MAPGAGTQAIERGLRLLELLSEAPMSVRELSERIELPRSTVARLLGALERYGYAARTDAGAYILGAHVLDLAARWHRQTGLVEVARPHLESLVHRVRETGHIMIREELRAVCVAYVESPAPIRLSIRLGMDLPLHAGAHAKVLLAYGPEPIVDAALARQLERLTPNTIADVPALRREIAGIQRLGYAESRSEVDQGANAIAAPIRAAGGAVIASIGVSRPEQRMDRSPWDELRVETLRAARQISHELGYAS